MREVAGSIKANDVARRLLGVLTGTGRRTAKRKHSENDDDDPEFRALAFEGKDIDEDAMDFTHEDADEEDDFFGAFGGRFL